MDETLNVGSVDSAEATPVVETPVEAPVEPVAAPEVASEAGVTVVEECAPQQAPTE